VSEQAPERAAQPGKPSPGGKPEGKENVFTRKIGPLPMWAWVAIIAGIIILYTLYKSRKSSGKGTGKGGKGGRGPRMGGFGAALTPPEIIHTIRYRRRGGGGEDEDEDQEHPHKSHRRRGDEDQDEEQDEEQRQRTGHPMIRPRARGRGHPARGSLSVFKTPSRGSTPSLQQIADGFNTYPDTIVQESYGRGVPSTAQWRRYVARSDWQAPLPHGVDLAIISRPR